MVLKTIIKAKFLINFDYKMSQKYKSVLNILCRHGPIHVLQNIVIYDPFLRIITIFTIFAI